MKKSIVSLIPRDEVRSVELSQVVNKLSDKIGAERHDHDLEYSLRSFRDAYMPFLADELLETIRSATEEKIFADKVFDSEENQAYRALIPVLMEHLSTKVIPGYPRYVSVEVTGWIRGEIVWVNRERFQLTGMSCPQCEVNPQAYGEGGGVRCVDRINCRWWYCA